jgi:zinc transporter ZupT
MLRKVGLKLVRIHLGFSTAPQTALFLGLLSGVSMPIGALMGVYMAPLNNQLNGGILAFGSGALIFAVTVSIYGNALHDLEDGTAYRWEDAMTVIGGLLGALFFLWVAKELEDQPASPAAAKLLHEVTPLHSASAGSLHSEVSSPKNEGYESPKIKRKSGLVAEAALNMKLRSESNLSEDELKQDRFVGMALFFGLLIDGIPEAVFMGFLAAQDNLTLPLIISLLIANFPEAFSSAALLSKTGMRTSTILAMWGSLCLLAGGLACIACTSILHFFPGYEHGKRLPTPVSLGVSLVDGFTGGVMLSCICAVMLKEAHHLVGKDGPLYYSVGFLTVLGFLSGITLEILGSHPHYNHGILRGIDKMMP